MPLFPAKQKWEFQVKGKYCFSFLHYFGKRLWKCMYSLSLGWDFCVLLGATSWHKNHLLFVCTMRIVAWDCQGLSNNDSVAFPYSPHCFPCVLLSFLKVLLVMHYLGVWKKGRGNKRRALIWILIEFQLKITMFWLITDVFLLGNMCCSVLSAMIAGPLLHLLFFSAQGAAGNLPKEHSTHRMGSLDQRELGPGGASEETKLRLFRSTNVTTTGENNNCCRKWLGWGKRGQESKCLIPEIWMDALCPAQLVILPVVLCAGTGVHQRNRHSFPIHKH